MPSCVASVGLHGREAVIDDREVVTEASIAAARGHAPCSRADDTSDRSFYCLQEIERTDLLTVLSVPSVVMQFANETYHGDTEITERIPATPGFKSLRFSADRVKPVFRADQQTFTDQSRRSLHKVVQFVHVR